MGKDQGYPEGVMTERSFTYYKDYAGVQSEKLVEDEPQALGSFN